MEWDPGQYERFRREREAPGEDLLALVSARAGGRAVDLGCGTGELTRRLAERLPGAEVLGLDSSASMLERAAALGRPGLGFAQASIEDFLDGKVAGAAGGWDVIFSNAALHWVADHERLIPRLLAALRPGGQLAAQVPADDGSAMRRVLAEVAGWRHALPVLDAGAYAELLWRHGGRDLVAFEKIYPHELPDADAIFEWARATAMLPYLEPLDEGGRAAFLDEVRRRLRLAYPGAPVFFGFRRVLFSAVRLQ